MLLEHSLPNDLILVASHNVDTVNLAKETMAKFGIND